MFDQFLESFRRVSESSMQAQQDLMKNWAQQWFTAAPGLGSSAEWGRAFQQRCLDLTVETLNKHRQTLDAAYQAGIHAIEQTFRVAEQKTPEDYRRTTEELWRKLFDAFRAQYETQLQEFQKFTAISFDMAQRPQG